MQNRMLSPLRQVAGAGIALSIAGTSLAQVTVTTDRSVFAAVLAVPLTVETFTDSAHGPLGLTLNSASSYTPSAFGTPITPGTIQPGVTYSVASGALVINSGVPGANFVGGFLSACRPNSGCLPSIPGTLDPLVTTFDRAVRGFGFEARLDYGEFDIVVNYAGGSFSQSFTPTTQQFFGFYRPTADILSASIITTNRNRQSTFAIDNFTFPTAVPEPATLLLMAGGLGLIGGLARRKRQAA